VKSESELRRELPRIRERVKSLSGFWVGEASAAIYALEWAIGKRETPPSEDIGRAHGGREKVAESLIRLVAKAPARVRSAASEGRTPARKAGGTKASSRRAPKRRA